MKKEIGKSVGSVEVVQPAEITRDAIKNKEKSMAIQQDQSPADMIRFAIEKGADLDKLEKLMILKERYDAGEARKAFNVSMVEAQKEIETVVKTKTNAQTKSKYADLENIITHAKPVYTKAGFSMSFYEGKSDRENNMRIMTDVIHCAGHKETYWYDLPFDGVGIKGNANMTAIHGKASSTSYGRRYLMCMIWNIPTGDDNDGNTPQEKISEEQIHNLRDLLISKGIEDKENKLLEILKIDLLENLPAKDYEKAVQLIKDAKGAK